MADYEVTFTARVRVSAPNVAQAARAAHIESSAAGMRGIPTPSQMGRHCGVIWSNGSRRGAACGGV